MKTSRLSVIALSAAAVMLLFTLPVFADDDNDGVSIVQDLPPFENSAAELQVSFDSTIAAGNQKLAALGNLDLSQLTFDNTVKAFEDILDEVTQSYYRVDLLKEVHPDAELRDKGFELAEAYSNWFIDARSNGTVYKVVKAYADTQPALTPAEQKLMVDTILTFKRAGFNALGEIKPEVLQLQKELNELMTVIGQNVVAGNKVLNHFTTDELLGLEQKHLDTLQPDGTGYLVKSGARGLLRDVIMTYAVKEETRKKAKAISNSRAAINLDLATTLVRKRLELAKVLGYNSWSDYKTEVYMAQTGAVASDFVNTISQRLKPKFNEEVAALAQYIEPGVNDNNNQVDSWDVYYFQRLYEAQALQVDYEGMRKYFEYEHVLTNMFKVFEESFGLYIDYVDVPGPWHQDVKLVRIMDALEQDDDGDDDEIEFEDREDARVLGYLYLDMFPRLDQGKMAHFASYGIVEGKELDSGKYRKPVNVLVCNFPVNADGSPQPLLFGDTSTLFHEFGHALHSILSNARFATQTGFNVPQDFVEVLSQVLENWITDENVFKRLAIPHPDVTDAWVSETVRKIKTANLATVGLFYERQFGFGIMDLIIHGYTDASQIPAATDPVNLISVTNEAMGNAYLPFPDSSHLITSFNHLLVWGYDAGYYSYAWADSIVAELTILFDESPQGFLDQELGLRLRKELFESGATRDVNISVEKFTGKPIDPERTAFLKKLGVQ